MRKVLIIVLLALVMTGCKPERAPIQPFPKVTSTHGLKSITPGSFCYQLNDHGQNAGIVYTCKGPGTKKWRR